MNKLGRGALGNATFQISKPHVFQFQTGRILKLVCFVPMFHHVTPGEGPILTQGHHINTLGRGPKGDATYQISKLYAFQFQRRIILKMILLIPMFSLVSHGAGQVLTTGASYEQTW